MMCIYTNFRLPLFTKGVVDDDIILAEVEVFYVGMEILTLSPHGKRLYFPMPARRPLINPKHQLKIVFGNH
jgi:hypothetical protein